MEKIATLQEWTLDISLEEYARRMVLVWKHDLRRTAWEVVQSSNIFKHMDWEAALEVAWRMQFILDSQES